MTDGNLYVDDGGSLIENTGTDFEEISDQEVIEDIMYLFNKLGIIEITEYKGCLHFLYSAGNEKGIYYSKDD